MEQDDLTGNVIEMPFVHGMHKLSIHISSDGGSLPEDLTVIVKNITEGSFDLSTGQIDIPGGTMKDISPRILSESEGKYSAILFFPAVLMPMLKDGLRYPPAARLPFTKLR